MNQRIIQLRKAKHVIKKLIGKPCWDVGCGKGVGSSFGLYLGRKIKRKREIRSVTRPWMSIKHDPEFHVLVWCLWRLSKNGRLVVTSDDCENHYKWCKYLRRLTGHKITKMMILNPFFDLQITFTRSYQLDIFCDHGTKEPSIDTNWEVFSPNDLLFGVYPKEWAQRRKKRVPEKK